MFINHSRLKTSNLTLTIVTTCFKFIIWPTSKRTKCLAEYGIVVAVEAIAIWLHRRFPAMSISTVSSYLSVSPWNTFNYIFDSKWDAFYEVFNSGSMKWIHMIKTGKCLRCANAAVGYSSIAVGNSSTDVGFPAYCRWIFQHCRWMSRLLPLDIPALPLDIPILPLDIPALPLDVPVLPFDVPALPFPFWQETCSRT